MTLLLILPVMLFLPELLMLCWWGGVLLRTVGLVLCFAVPKGPGRRALWWAAGLSGLAVIMATIGGEMSLGPEPEVIEIPPPIGWVHTTALVLELVSLVYVFHFIDWLANTLGSYDAQDQATTLKRSGWVLTGVTVATVVLADVLPLLSVLLAMSGVVLFVLTLIRYTHTLSTLSEDIQRGRREN